MAYFKDDIPSSQSKFHESSENSALNFKNKDFNSSLNVDFKFSYLAESLELKMPVNRISLNAQVFPPGEWFQTEDRNLGLGPLTC